MDYKDRIYRHGLEAGAATSITNQFNWQADHGLYASDIKIDKMNQYILDRLYSALSKKEPLEVLSAEECFNAGKEKGEEVAMLEGLKYLDNINLLQRLSKEAQVDYVLHADEAMDKDSAVGMIYSNFMVKKIYKTQFYSLAETDSSLLELLENNKFQSVEDVWPQTKIKKSKTVEAILLKYPQMFEVIIQPLNNKKFGIISGYQELKALDDYLNNRFALRGLKLATELNGLMFEQLPQMAQLQLRSTEIRVSVLDADLSIKEVKDIARRLKR